MKWEAKHYPEGSVIRPVGSNVSILRISLGKDGKHPTPCLSPADADLIVHAVNGLHDLENVHKIQGTDGNWDANEYMRGIYNGLELALSIFQGRTPAYKDAV